MVETEDYLQQMHNWLNRLHADLAASPMKSTSTSSLSSSSKSASKKPQISYSKQVREGAKSRPKRELLLIAKGLKYKAKTQEHKRRLQAAEDLSSPFHPLIRSRSSSPVPVSERLYNAGINYERHKQDLRAQKRQSLEDQDFKIRSATPDPSKPPVELRLTSMKEVYEQNRQKRFIDQVEGELKTVKSPVLCKKSTHLAVKVNGTKSVEERLIDAGRRAAFDQKVKADTLEREARQLAKPSVTSLAEHLHSEKAVEDRLLEYTDKYRENMQQRLLNQETYSFAPKLCNYRRSDWSPYRSQSNKKLFDYSQDYPFKPHISKKSQSLAKRRGTAQERLLSRSPKPRVDLQDETACTFTPHLNERTLELTSTRSGDRSFGEKWAELTNKTRTLSQIMQDLAEIDSECTFTPKTHSSPMNRSQTETLKRLQNWASYRDEKLRKLINSELKS